MEDSMPPPQTSKRLDEKMHWNPQRLVLPSGSKPSPIVTGRRQHSATHEAWVGNPSLPITRNDKDSDSVAASVSSSRAQSWTRPPARRPSLRRTKRIAARAVTFTPPVPPPRSSKIALSTNARKSIQRGATSRWNPSNASSEPHPTLRYVAGTPAKTLNTGPPRVYPFRPAVYTYLSMSEERPPVHNEKGEEEESDEDEEEESEESDDDGRECNDEEYEDETEGEEGTHTTNPQRSSAASPRIVASVRDRDKPAQVHPRDVKPGTQLYTPPSKSIRPASDVVYRVPQVHQNASPPVARRLETRPDTKRLHYPRALETFPPRPISFEDSRLRPQRIPDGPHRTTWPSNVAYPPPFGPANRSGAYHTNGFGVSGDVAGPSSEWGGVSEAGGSGQRSIYNLQSALQSNASIAQSMYMEQRVARREEEAARREEEAMRKEEDARGLEMAARRAFAWVQGLEARAGRIHDAAVKADTEAKRRDAEIWKKEAEVLRMQAETAKREVEVAKREIAAERAEQEARRKEREARRKEAELLRKEEGVLRKEQEAIRMEEDVRRKKMEIHRREERLRKREKGRRGVAEDWIGTKDAIVSAWEKLKGRISREPQVDKQKALAHPHLFEGPGTSLYLNDMDGSPDPSPRAQIQGAILDGSTREDAPRPRNVEQWRNMVDASGILDLGDSDLRSVSNAIPSDCGTSAEASAEYTVRTVHSYKERLHRSPAGYFRHVG